MRPEGTFTYTYMFITLCHFRISRLTWHEEIWVKIGGDKGGGTFKMSFQVVTTTNPNSPQNTIVFSIFEAPDSYATLSIALEPYIKQIEDLKTKQWRYV